MLKQFSKFFHNPSKNWLAWYSLENGFKVKQGKAFNIIGGNSRRPYGTRYAYDHVREDQTLHFKVLEYMRQSKCFAALPTPIGNTHSILQENKHAAVQMLLTMAHSSNVKTTDVLNIIDIFADARYPVHDLISNPSLTGIIRRQISQNITLMTHDEMHKLSASIKKLKYKNVRFLSHIPSEICRECERRAAESDLGKCLELFDMLLILYGNRIYKRKEFDVFMGLFEANIESARTHHLVQILHYIGLAKKNKISYEIVDTVLSHLGDSFGELSFEDAGIAVSGIFRSNTKYDPSSSVIKMTAKHLKKKIKSTSSLSDLESHGFVGMIKLLRLARHHDEEILTYMNTFVLEADAKTLNPQVVCHILALYASHSVYNYDVFTRLEFLLLNYLKSDSSHLRLRDIARFLYCFSYVGHECREEMFALIRKSLMEFVVSGEAIRQASLLPDCLVSLAALGQYPHDVIRKAFELDVVQELGDYQRSKRLARLLVLYECIKIEAPDLVIKAPSVDPSNLPHRSIADEIFHRPALAQLLKGAEYINNMLGANAFKLHFPIPHINYASLTVDVNKLPSQEEVSHLSDEQGAHVHKQLHQVRQNLTESVVAIEMLDSKCILARTSLPTGIIRLKMRLMQKSGWSVKVINNTELEACQSDVSTVASLIMHKLRS